MLQNEKTIATIAVKDIRLARKFYEGTLGFKVRDEDAGVPVYGSGSSKIRIYESEHSGSNKGARANWAGGDEIDGVLQALQSF
jgi:catechol 2,3-dioxygenase-like lactoylglutathione lyase family enzyme